MSTAPTPVTVNFNVNIDASGNINVFGDASDAPTNFIVPLSTTLPVNALYDASVNGGLIEFWEPASDLGNIYAQLANSAEGVDVSGALMSYAGKYQTAAKVLAHGLQRILVNTLDCSQASPFSGYKTVPAYYQVSDFGRVALSAHAEDIFGHVAATAAITNDQAFMAAMLSVTSATVADGATGAQRYSAWTKSAMVDASDVELWSDAQSRTDANLAVALAKAIVSKGLDANGNIAVSDIENKLTNQSGSVDGKLASIVKKVIGQDASRAMGVDNNELAPNRHQFLRFYEGDKVIVNITLKTPAVNTGSNKFTAASAEAKAAADRNYAVLITLGPKEELPLA
jgi:hypothetical protein